MEKTMKITMNDTRKAVINTLENADAPMTLKEIAEALGLEKLNSGTTNALVAAGILKVAGTKKVPVVKYNEVNTYTVGDLTKLEKTE